MIPLKVHLLLYLSILFCISVVKSENKYSKSANVKEVENEPDLRTQPISFRMQKINIIWDKAKRRISLPKLKSLYSELVIHDQDEINLKRLKSDGQDKEGLHEAKVRRKLLNIMDNYGILEHFEDVNKRLKLQQHKAYNLADDDFINKSLFKDKKLNMLWKKAETAGFTSEELSALKEEFQHHQEKIDQYYSVLEDANTNDVEENLDRFNKMDTMIKENEVHKEDTILPVKIKNKHKEIVDNYERLNRIAAKGPKNQEFIEPKVQQLWHLAIQANFTHDELLSLKTELQHYESRLLKLRHLHSENVAAGGNNMDYFDETQKIIKKHARKVEKMHMELENRILERHSEL